MIMGFTYEYTYQGYKYYAYSVHLLYIQKPYTSGFPAPGCKCDCTLSLWHICDQVA